MIEGATVVGSAVGRREYVGTLVEGTTVGGCVTGADVARNGNKLNTIKASDCAKTKLELFAAWAADCNIWVKLPDTIEAFRAYTNSI